MTTVSGSILDKIKQGIENTGLERFDSSRVIDEGLCIKVDKLDVAANSKLIGKQEISGILSKKLKLR